MEKATVGRIVHYVLANGEHRPAIVVSETKSNIVNIQVFLDGSNDLSAELHDNTLGAIFEHERVYGNAWRLSVHYANAKKKVTGTWHWPERTVAAEELEKEND